MHKCTRPINAECEPPSGKREWRQTITGIDMPCFARVRLAWTPPPTRVVCSHSRCYLATPRELWGGWYFGLRLAGDDYDDDDDFELVFA